MIRAAYDQDVFPGSALFLDNVVYLFYKRTCGIYNAYPFCLQLVIDSFFYPWERIITVPPDKSSSSSIRISIDHTLTLHIFYHFFVVDDRPVGIYRSAARIDLFIDCVYGTLHPETKAGSFCFDHFHTDYLQ